MLRIVSRLVTVTELVEVTADHLLPRDPDIGDSVKLSRRAP